MYLVQYNCTSLFVGPHGKKTKTFCTPPPLKTVTLFVHLINEILRYFKYFFTNKNINF